MSLVLRFACADVLRSVCSEILQSVYAGFLRPVCAGLLLGALLCGPGAAQDSHPTAQPTTQPMTRPTTRPMTLDDVLAMKRIASPALSPDGRRIVFTVTTPDRGLNKNLSDLWVVSVDGTGMRQLTTHVAADRSPVWSPDGKWIAFESSRSGDNQIWLISPEGGEPQQFTHLSTGAAQAVWSPDASLIAYVSEIFPEYSDRPFPESDSLNATEAEGTRGRPGQSATVHPLALPALGPLGTGEASTHLSAAGGRRSSPRSDPRRPGRSPLFIHVCCRKRVCVFSRRDRVGLHRDTTARARGSLEHQSRHLHHSRCRWNTTPVHHESRR